MPRPKGKEQKEIQVNFRVTEAQFAILKESADATKHTVPWLVADLVSDYCAVIAGEFGRKKKTPIHSLQDARRLIDEAIKAASMVPAKPREPTQ